MRFERVKGRNHSKVARKGIPATWSRVGKGLFPKRRRREEQRGVKNHVKRGSNPNFVSKDRGCKTVNALKSDGKKFEVNSLMDSEPVQILVVMGNMTARA